MLDNIERFDMKKPPQRSHLRWLTFLGSLPTKWSHKGKLTKTNMKGIKPPYLLLGNHNAFMDMNILFTSIYPHHANYVVAIDGFIGREGILRYIGGICKRKFTSDLILVKQLKQVIKNKDIAVIYPEARYSLCGTTAIIPESVAKLAKLLKVPVVTLICHGHHINSPFWNLHNRKIKGIEAEMTCIVNQEEISTLSVEEINNRIQKQFIYDDYKWQLEKKVKVTYEGRAEGLHHVLYKCPHCEAEYKMSTKGTILRCNNCNKEWEYSEYGELHALEGETEYSHIPDWYEYQRECVRKEIEEGKYHFESEVHVDALPNAKEFIHLGKAYLVHDYTGFHLKGKYQDEEYEVNIPTADSYSVHIEYDYLGKYGDCIDLNTLDDTLYVYPEGEEFAVTKISLATEELYKYHFKNK